MGSAHYFLIDDLSIFLLNLEARSYTLNRAHRETNGWVVYSKVTSGALVKHYSYATVKAAHPPYAIRVTYALIGKGVPLKKLGDQLKTLNRLYRQSLPGWKTKRPARRDVQHRRAAAIQRFLKNHRELIHCFKYQSDDRLTEGNMSFNLHIASTPKEQGICIEFIKALIEAHSPGAIVRGHREVDKPAQQRNGWIRRFADMHRKRGWTAREIIYHTQKQLREGTWNQRSKLQYNLSPATISKLAGLKLPSMSHTWSAFVP